MSSLHRKNLPKDIFKWFLCGKYIIAPHGSTRVSLKTAHSIHWLIMILPLNHAIWISHRGFFHVFPISRYILQPPRLSRSMSPSHKDRHRQLRAQQFPNVQIDHPSVFPGLSTKLSSHFEKGVQLGICLGYVQYCAVVWDEKDENRESFGTTNQI